MTVTTVSQGSVPVYADKLAPTGREEDAMLALQQIFGTLAVSESGLMQESQKTEEVVQKVFGQLRERFDSLSEENLTLREQFIASEGRQKELEVAHEADRKALQGQADHAAQKAESLQKELTETLRKADANRTAVIAEKDRAVKTATEAADTRVKEIAGIAKAKIAAIQKEITAAISGASAVSIPNVYQYNLGCHPKLQERFDAWHAWSIHNGKMTQSDADRKLHNLRITYMNAPGDIGTDLMFQIDHADYAKAMEAKCRAFENAAYLASNKLNNFSV